MKRKDGSKQADENVKLKEENIELKKIIASLKDENERNAKKIKKIRK